MSGDIDIEKSKIKGNVSNMSGTISVSSSNIEGNVNNLSGKIKISDESKVIGDISNSSGSIILSKSSITGNVSNIGGKTLLRDSVVDGVIITSKPGNLLLEGTNKIRKLIIRGFKKPVKMDAEKVKADLATMGIFIKNIGQVINVGGGTVINTFHNNNRVSTKIITPDEPLQFRLPKGNIIDTIRFSADKKGVLIIDKGAEFAGKLINGIIKRV